MLKKIVLNGSKYLYISNDILDDGLYFFDEIKRNYVKFSVIPTDLVSEFEKYLIDINNNEYSNLRKLAYDKLNQFELMSNDLLNGTTTWNDSIQAIKSKYPKPTV